MNTRGLKIFFLIGMFCLGYGLTACTRQRLLKKCILRVGMKGALVAMGSIGIQINNQ
ncbi:hypothetical protein PGH42_05450 [Legionella pneumophila]|nr:hypothetical protein PGH42_05450 [Legionella pneumophila]